MKVFKVNRMYWKDKNTKMIEEVDTDDTTLLKKDFGKFVYVKTKQRALDTIKVSDKFYLQAMQNELDFVVKRKQRWKNWTPNNAEFLYTADLDNLVLSHKDNSKMLWEEAKEKLIKRIQNSEKEIRDRIAVLCSVKK